MEVVYEREIETKNIKISPRPVWKCRTCEFYGKRPSCPPLVPNWKEAKELVNEYSKAILIKFKISMDNFEQEKRNIIKYLLKREKELFINHLFVLALFPGACNICPECEFEQTNVCKYPTMVRPSMDAIGIELTSIVKINYKEEVLYSIILLE